MKTTVRYFIQLITGLVILFWAFRNLYPIEWFEYRLVEQHLANWFLVPFIARITIAIKFIVGVFLILNINPKKSVPKVLLVLLLLSVYDLNWQVFKQDKIMAYSYSFIIGTNMIVNLSIIAVLLFVSILLIVKSKQTDLRFKTLKYLVGAILFFLPFILNPIYPQDFSDVSKRIDEPFDTASVVSSRLKQLGEQKILVAYFSVNCQFCLNAAKKIAIAQKQHKNFPPVYICMQGNEKLAARFFTLANANFEYEVLSLKDFSTLTHFVYPMFVLVENGIVTRKWDGRTFNYGTMMEFSN